MFFRDSYLGKIEIPTKIDDALGQIIDGTWNGIKDKMEVEQHIPVVQWAKWVEQQLAQSFAPASKYVRGISCIIANVFVGGWKSTDGCRVGNGQYIGHSNLIWINLPTDGSGMEAAVLHVYEPRLVEMNRFERPCDRIFQSVCSFFGFPVCFTTFSDMHLQCIFEFR